MSSYFFGLFHKKNSRLKTHSDELHLMHAVPGEGFGAINKNFLIFCSATVCHSHLHQTHLFWMSLEVKLDTATFRGNLWQRMDYFLFHHPVTLRIIPSFGHTEYYSIIWSHWMTVTTKKVAMFSVADHWWMMYWYITMWLRFSLIKWKCLEGLFFIVSLNETQMNENNLVPWHLKSHSHLKKNLLTAPHISIFRQSWFYFHCRDLEANTIFY